MRTNKKSLHKPEGIKRVVQMDTVEPWPMVRYTKEAQIMYWEDYRFYQTTTVTRGSKVIYQNAVPCEPPQYHLNYIIEMKRRIQEEQELMYPTEDPVEKNPEEKKSGKLKNLLENIWNPIIFR